MVNFVRPYLLGTKSEFRNMFVNPIQNGQFMDSTRGDVIIMKNRSHVLHKKLSNVVQVTIVFFNLLKKNELTASVTS